MLVVSRKPGEKLFIGDDIEVVILEWNHSRCRVGVKAPKETLILRTELLPYGDPRRPELVVDG